MDDSLLPRAFDVKQISSDFDPSLPPTDGHEYLQHVMFEASKCPSVVVAEIDKKKLKKHVNISFELSNNQPNEGFVPSPDWQNHQIQMFSDLRKKIEISKNSNNFKPLSLPGAQEEEKWLEICFGEKSKRLEPSLTLLLSMSQPLLGALLEYQFEWLKTGLKENQGKWLYALLACLEEPISPLICSLIRDLARECVNIRRTQNSLEENDRITLNLIVCLVKKYFWQLDLPD